MPDCKGSSRKIAIIAVIFFVLFSGMVLAIFVAKSSNELGGTYLGGFGIAIVVVAAMIYYKVSGRPLPASNA